MKKATETASTTNELIQRILETTSEMKQPQPGMVPSTELKPQAKPSAGSGRYKISSMVVEIEV